MISQLQIFFITATIHLLLSCQLSFSQVQQHVSSTDSSIIREQHYLKGSERMEYIFDRAIIKYEWRNKQEIVELKGNYDTIGNLVGHWYEYNSAGRLIKIENFDKRTWQAVDRKVYPFKDYLDKIKKSADQIIIKEYGTAFFINHVKWNMKGSAVYFPDGAGANWTDTFKRKPTSFLLRYDILLDSIFYEDMIEMNLDADGKLFNTTACLLKKGFEKVGYKNLFSLNRTLAYKEAKQRGLNSDVNETDFRLIWECRDKEDTSKHNGRYLFYVYKRKGIKIDDSVEDKKHRFDIYVFNPWDGSFIERREEVFNNELLFPIKEPLISILKRNIK